MPPHHENLVRAKVLELNTASAAFFAAQATAGSVGRAYLNERVGAAALAAGPWLTGYAPEEWTGLTNHLRRQGATPEEIVEAGLGFRTSRGGVVDVFRDRAIIAVRDLEGSVVGFVGRDLSGDVAAPKYLNTGSTAAYRKGDHLLGLYEARLLTVSPSSPEAASGAADWPRLVRVEGPFDAIAVTAAGGGRYAGIAPLGTALTDRQARQLADRVKWSGVPDQRIWLALDGDRAGRSAAEKDHWALRDHGLDPRSLHIPNRADPAQLWRDDHHQLRGLLEEADTSPTSGIVVIDNAIEQLGSHLVHGDPDAVAELAAVHDMVLSGLRRDDHDLVVAYTTSAVAALAPSPGQDGLGEGKESYCDVATSTSSPGQDRRNTHGQDLFGSDDHDQQQDLPSNDWATPNHDPKAQSASCTSSAAPLGRAAKTVGVGASSSSLPATAPRRPGRLSRRTSLGR